MKQLLKIRKVTYCACASFLLVTSIVGTLLATAGPASADVVRNCAFPHGFDRGAPIFNISVRNMSCSSALRTIHSRRWSGGRYQVASCDCYVVQ